MLIGVCREGQRLPCILKLTIFSLLWHQLAHYSILSINVVFLSSRRPGGADKTKPEDQFVNHHVLTKHIQWVPKGGQVSLLTFVVEISVVDVLMAILIRPSILIPGQIRILPHVLQMLDIIIFFACCSQQRQSTLFYLSRQRQYFGQYIEFSVKKIYGVA
jgi:hypothetical protein